MKDFDIAGRSYQLIALGEAVVALVKESGLLKEKKRKTRATKKDAVEDAPAEKKADRPKKAKKAKKPLPESEFDDGLD